MLNNKLGKKQQKRRHSPSAKTSHRRILVMYSFANKVA